MPISKSAKKALRVARTKTSVNRYRKSRVKDALKNVTAETHSTAVSMVDKAAKWGIIHPNKAARLKSKLARELGSASAKPVSDKPTKAKNVTKAKAAAKAKTKVAKAKKAPIKSAKKSA